MNLSSFLNITKTPPPGLKFPVLKWISNNFTVCGGGGVGEGVGGGRDNGENLKL